MDARVHPPAFARDRGQALVDLFSACTISRPRVTSVCSAHLPLMHEGKVAVCPRGSYCHRERAVFPIVCHAGGAAEGTMMKRKSPRSAGITAPLFSLTSRPPPKFRGGRLGPGLSCWSHIRRGGRLCVTAARAVLPRRLAGARPPRRLATLAPCLPFLMLLTGE